MPLSAIAAQFGTPPLCVYSARRARQSAWRDFDAAFAGVPHLVCYAMKANPNLAVLDSSTRGLGSGFDIVSGGELARVLAAGGDPGKVVFFRRRQDRSGNGTRRSLPGSSASTSSPHPNSPDSMPVAARAGRVAPVEASA